MSVLSVIQTRPSQILDLQEQAQHGNEDALRHFVHVALWRQLNRNRRLPMSEKIKALRYLMEHASIHVEHSPTEQIDG